IEASNERIRHSNYTVIESLLTVGMELKNIATNGVLNAFENFGKMLGSGASAGDAFKTSILGMLQEVVPAGLKFAGL
ncbi:hypothetical protein ACI3PL_32750, partial [Lacticaseibacillus paracasei]